MSHWNQVINVEPSCIFYFSSSLNIAPGSQTSKAGKDTFEDKFCTRNARLLHLKMYTTDATVQCN